MKNHVKEEGKKCFKQENNIKNFLTGNCAKKIQVLFCLSKKNKKVNKKVKLIIMKKIEK